MYRSIINNQYFETWDDYHQTMFQIYDEFKFTLFDRKSADYRRLRLLTQQYVKTRQIVQSMTGLKQIEHWLYGNQLDLLNVPFNFMLMSSERNPTGYYGFNFRNVVVNNDIDTIYYTNGSIEEPIKGKGWSGEIKVLHRRYPRYDSNALRNGLSSMGIYVHDMQYDYDDDHAFLLLSFNMLQRDFKLKNFRPSAWIDRDGSEDDSYIMSPAEIAQWEHDRLFDDDLQFTDLEFDDGLE